MGIIKSVKTFISGEEENKKEKLENSELKQNNFNDDNYSNNSKNINETNTIYQPAKFSATNQYNYYKEEEKNDYNNSNEVPQYYNHEFKNNNQNLRNSNEQTANFYRYKPDRYIDQVEEKVVSKKDARASKYFYQPKNYRVKQNSLRLSKDYVNKIMPLEIAREIKSEKIRSIIMMLFGIVGSLATIYFIIYYFIWLNNTNIIPKFLWINPDYIPRPFLTIAILIICLGILFSGTLSLLRVKLEANHYISNLNLGNHTIPHFLIENYKKMIVRSIVLNWIAFPTYIFGGIILGILYGFQQHSGQKFMFGFWSWGIVGDLKAAIMINIIVLISMLTLHIINIIITKKRKLNIFSYYGYEIVNPQEIQALKKRTNRICLVIFIFLIIIITLIISIPWIISRRRQRKGDGVVSRIFGLK